jgi:hypothetical protein
MKVIRCFSTLLVVLLPCTAFLGQSRRPGAGRLPTAVRDETGREANVLNKDQSRKETTADPVVKQAIEDFMAVQKLGRSIHELSKKEPIELERIATAAKEVNTRANRLKASLLLPPPPKDAATVGARQSSDELLTQIAELNTSIRTFVTNPRFRNLQSATDPEADAREASANLVRIIEISRAINRRAEQLSRIAKNQ